MKYELPVLSFLMSSCCLLMGEHPPAEIESGLFKGQSAESALHVLRQGGTLGETRRFVKAAGAWVEAVTGSDPTALEALMLADAEGMVERDSAREALVVSRHWCQRGLDLYAILMDNKGSLRTWTKLHVN